MLKKPVIQNVSRVLAASFKPAYLRESEGEGDNAKKSPHVVFVTPQGQERDMVADPRCWARVLGTPMSGQKHSGFHARDKDSFIVCLRNEGARQIAVAVHCFPAQQFDARTTPAELAELEDIKLKVDQSSGEVIITKLPLKVKVPHVQAIIAAIDALPELVPGETLVPNIGARIESIIGSEVTVSVALNPDESLTTVGKVMQGIGS